jgi:hypothetical protein
MRRTTLLAALVLATGTTLLPAVADAAVPVRCGDRITADTTLTKDLRCAGGTGLVLAAGVTLDLGGHRLIGPGAATSDGNGVEVRTATEATVRNGRIEGWAAGANVLPDDDSDGSRLAVDAVTFADNGAGVSLFFGNVRIAGSEFRGNTTAVGAFTADGSVTDTRFRDNGTVIAASAGSFDVTRSTLTDNRIGMTGDDVGFTVVDSVVRDGDTAFSTFRGGVTLARSEVRGYRIGLDNDGSSLSTATDSRFTGNGTAVQLGIDSSTGLTRNQFRGNGTGVTVKPGLDSPIRQAGLVDNVFERNGDGVFLPDDVVSLQGNSAVRNTGWGLYAPHAIDLGGNTASRNGNQPQCVGVVC